MCQVGLGTSTTTEFLAKARNIVTQHRELQNQVDALHAQINQLEMTQIRNVSVCSIQALHSNLFVRCILCI